MLEDNMVSIKAALEALDVPNTPEMTFMRVMAGRMELSPECALNRAKNALRHASNTYEIQFYAAQELGGDYTALTPTGVSY